MGKHIFDNNNGLWYELRGDFIFLAWKYPPKKEERHVGVWGQRHLRYLRQHKKVFYTDLLTSGRLPTYLADVEKQA